jgi:hypothetical protein
LIPATARFNVAHAKEGLWMHGKWIVGHGNLMGSFSEMIALPVIDCAQAVKLGDNSL